MRKVVWIVGLGLLGACASAPEPAPPAPAALEQPTEVDPVGTYTFSTTVQGMAVDGQMRIGGSRGSWGGSIYSDVTGEMPISRVTVDGQQVVVLADTPDGPVRIRMMFNGESFSGDWVLGADGGTLRGRRITQ